jgi:hypothetical protein
MQVCKGGTAQGGAFLAKKSRFLIRYDSEVLLNLTATLPYLCTVTELVYGSTGSSNCLFCVADISSYSTAEQMGALYIT